MKRNIIIGLVFIVCLILVGYIGYYLGSKTIEPKAVETVVEKEPNIDEIKESVKTEIYEDAYNEGYEKGKTGVFELMLKSENNEEETAVEDVKPVENKEYNQSDTLLIQLDSENNIMLCGDCGVANFFINNKKLKEHDFSDVIYN